MADQNFRVKRGLEVGVGGTVLTASQNGNIGIATANPSATLHVNGKTLVSGNAEFVGVTTFKSDIVVDGTLRPATIVLPAESTSSIDQITGTHLSYSGISTIGTAVIDLAYVKSGIVTNLTTSGIGSITTLNATTGNIVTGVVTTLSGTTATYDTGNLGTLNATTGNIVTGVVTTLSGTTATYDTGNLGTLNATTGNIVTGIITTLSGTTATYDTGNLTTLNAITGVVTTISGTTATYTTGNLGTLNATTGVVTTLSGTTATYDTGNLGTLNATTGNIVTGVVTTLSGTNLTYTTGNLGTLNATTGNIVTGLVTTISGTTATYTTGNLGTLNATTGNIVTGVVTTISGTTATYTTGNLTNLTSGIGTITTFNSTSSSITHLGGTNINIIGVGTIPTLDTTNGDITYLTGINLTYTGLGDINKLHSNFGTIGVGTIATLNSTTATITNLLATNISASGIITASGGFSGSLTGNSSTATTLASSRDFSISGDVATSSSVSFNGSSNVNLSVLLSNNFNANTSGIITSTTRLSTGASGTGINITQNTISGPSELVIDPAGIDDNTGVVRIKGDLYVDGTQTFINSTSLEISDFIVGIASTATSDLLADGAGIKIGPDNTLLYDHTNTSLKSSENLNLASGKTYKINGTDVLSATTLGAEIVNSSLTSVGTLTKLSVGNINSTGIVTASGGFVGNLTGNVTGNLDGTASSASQLQASRDFSLTGDVATTASVGFNGSSNVNLVTRLSNSFNANTTGIITATRFISSGLNISGIATINQLHLSGFTPDGSDYGIINYVPVANGTGGWSWQPIAAAGGGSLDGITLLEEGSAVGSAGSIISVNLIGNNITATATGTSATITLNDNPSFGNVSLSGIITASSFVKSGGTSSQFLKADGTVDSSTYLTSYTETDTLNSVTGRGNSTSNGISVGVLTATSFVKSGGTSNQFLKADGTVDSSTYLTSYTETQTLDDVLTLGKTSTTGIQVGISTVANQLSITSSDGSVGRLDFYCEVNNLHYTRLQAAPHGTYSGNAIVVVPNRSGTLLLTDGDGSNLTNIGYASSAGISSYTSEWILGANGSTDYTFTGPGFAAATNDPTLFLIRGQQYKFTNTMGAHPFRIQSTPNGSVGTQYNTGILNNDVFNGTLTWNVQFDAPDILYYQCTAHPSMGGKIYIVNAGIGSDVSVNTTGIVTASSFVKSGGTSTQFLKADGSVDSNTYLTSYTETDTLATVTGRGSSTTQNITAASFIKSGGTSAQFLKADGTVDSNTYLTTTGSGINLTGIVTSIAAGSGISIDQSTGKVTITATGGGGGGGSGITEVVQDTTPQLGGDLDLNGKYITGSGGINITGVVTATDFNSSSDINLKNNVRLIEDPLSKVMSIRGVNFEWKQNSETSAGVIAQEIEEVMPELVKEVDGKKTVNYNGLIGLLVEVVKDQQKQIDELREKLS